jgi:hypothetical protein
MRKTVLLAAGLAASAYLLRRTRRFGPLGAMAGAVLLEQLAASLRGHAEPAPAAGPPPPPEPSLWAKLTGQIKPSPADLD